MPVMYQAYALLRPDSDFTLKAAAPKLARDFQRSSSKCRPGS
jgi:hypothetical protein